MTRLWNICQPYLLHMTDIINTMYNTTRALNIYSDFTAAYVFNEEILVHDSFFFTLRYKH